MKDCLLSRVPVTASLGLLSGMSSGHVIGNIVLRLGISWGAGGAALGLQFFGTSLAIQAIRQKDDFMNYGISGAITSIASLKYLELVGFFPKSGYGKIGGAVVFGLATGIIFKLLEAPVFNTCRSGWLASRHYLKHTSTPRIVIARPKVPISREMIGHVPPLKEGMSFRTLGAEETPKK